MTLLSGKYGVHFYHILVQNSLLFRRIMILPKKIGVQLMLHKNINVA